MRQAVPQTSSTNKPLSAKPKHN